MPTISRFYGILIQMYFGDHAPPHFHALYAEFEAVIDIETLGVMRGSLPAAQLLWCWNGLNCTARNSTRIGNYAYRTNNPRRSFRFLDRRGRTPLALARHRS